jgi:hypothetical protein
MVWSTRVVPNSIFDDAQTFFFFFFFFYQKKNKKLSSKRPPPVLKRTSLTSSRVFVRVSNRKREREGEGKRGCSAKNEEAKQTAARKRMNE